MRDTAQILQTDEECSRKNFWSQQWEKNKLLPARMLDMGIREGLTYAGADFGVEAGSYVVELGATRGVDSDQYDQHAEVVHLASLADLITVAARKKNDKPWKIPDPVDGWNPSCFISPDGQYLRRIVHVSTWGEERQNSITRSWATLGPVAFYGLPMQIGIVITGARRDGRYHSFWTHGLQHPVNKKLRFRKKKDIETGFKTTWRECWRQDHDEISTQAWLDAMIEDEVLQDVFFKIDMPLMGELSRDRIKDVAKRKLDRIENTKTLPDEQYAHCSWPVKCQFLGSCNRGDTPSGKSGFISIRPQPVGR